MMIIIIIIIITIIIITIIIITIIIITIILIKGNLQWHFHEVALHPLFPDQIGISKC